MDQEQIKAMLKDRNLRTVASAAGVAYQPLLMWVRGDVAEPKYSMVMKIVRYLESQQLTDGGKVA